MIQLENNMLLFYMAGLIRHAQMVYASATELFLLSTVQKRVPILGDLSLKGLFFNF